MNREGKGHPHHNEDVSISAEGLHICSQSAGELAPAEAFVKTVANFSKGAYAPAL